MLTKTQNPFLDIQKEAARLYVHDNRLDEALEIYLEILRTNPDDSEVLMEMRNLYFSVGNGQVQKNIEITSKHEQMDDGNSRQANQAGMTPHPENDEEAVPTSPDAVRQLLQALTKRVQPISEEELMNAANLLQEIVNSSRPAEEVAKRLDEIDSLLPALIDLNIRQARLDGRPDLATGLGHLKTNISLQKAIATESRQASIAEEKLEARKPETFSGRICIFKPEIGKTDTNDRVRLLQASLKSNNLLSSDNECSTLYPDLAIFSNPFMDTELMEKMALFSTAQVPIILDLDESDSQTTLSIKNPSSAYTTSQNAYRAYASALILADLITVESEDTAEDLRSNGYTVMTIPNGWSMENPYWAETKHPIGGTLRLGWFGNTGTLDDLALIRRPLIRLLREFENDLRIIIVGDQDAYRMFDNVPEGVKTFVPCLSDAELPYIINQMDIVLLPSRKLHTDNRSSDELLMYAGIKRLPWASSPTKTAENWKKGGLVCSTMEEWHANLRHLIIDKDLRDSLGKEGCKNAERREMKGHLQHWYRAFNTVRSMKNSIFDETENGGKRNS